MRILWVAGVAPIVRNMDESRTFYAGHLGLPLPGDDYPMTDDLPGVKHFGLWSLSEAAESCFGATAWPADMPPPQAAIEYEVESAAAVAAAAAELEAAGYRLLVGPKSEPWGQEVVRLLSPEGLLTGVTFTPWQHGAAAGEAEVSAPGTVHGALNDDASL